MKPPPFRYVAPETIDEAVATLGEHSEDGKVLAGGQSLVPLMNMRLARPSVLVDVCKVAGLEQIERVDNHLAIGAAARQTDVLTAPAVARAAPIMREALRHVGHEANRNRGTLGGSAAHADPAAEIPAVLLALDAELVAVGPRGERTVSADDFFKGFFTTALGGAEVLTEIRIPVTDASARRWAFLEVARRSGDFAMAGVAVCLGVDGAGAVASARIALLGIDQVPVRATGAEALVCGSEITVELAREAGAAVAASVEPSSDVHASAAYRRHAVGVLVQRALVDAEGGNTTDAT